MLLSFWKTIKNNLVLNEIPGESCIYHIGGKNKQHNEKWCLREGKIDFTIENSTEKITNYDYYPETFVVSSAYSATCKLSEYTLKW